LIFILWKMKNVGGKKKKQILNEKIIKRVY